MFVAVDKRGKVLALKEGQSICNTLSIISQMLEMYFLGNHYY